MKPSSTGFLKYKGYKTYYEIYGKKTKKTPLLVLHGGPGSAHNYLLGLALLANSGRQVIFYDQLGCGLSDMPDDNSLWEINTFVDELKEVRRHLKLDMVHILGHSWGGMLAIEYLLEQPDGIRSAVLASAMISMPMYQKEVDKLKMKLPESVGKIMNINEIAGTTKTREYKDAYLIYAKHHLFRGQIYPVEFRTPKGRNGSVTYEKMWGQNEAFAFGTMKDWNMIPRLHEIKVPTLVISGEFDELTPKQAKITAKKIPNSQLNIISDASHCAHIEREDEYLQVVKEFLEEVD